MRDRIPAIVIFLAFVAIAATIGGCVVDFAKAERDSAAVVIADKTFTPGHYEQDCNTDEDGKRHCEDDWVPPSWALIYEDGEGRFTAAVTQGMYERLQIGQSALVLFWRGRYTGLRYGQQFELALKPVEGW